MNDCPNAEMRDRLPDLLHDRLDARTRAAVAAHVADCADCRAELALLEGVRGMMVARTPRVDINYVVNALPKQYAKTGRVAPRHRTWVDWRIAAAVTVLVVGGGSVAVMNRAQTSSVVAVAPDSSRSVARSTDTTTPSDSAVSSNSKAPVARAPSARQTVARADEAPAASALATGDLNEQQLRLLLDEINQLQAVPITEPEPVTIRVNSGASSSPEGA